MHDHENYKGIFVAMNACYDDQDRIWPAAIQKLTSFLLEKGVQGLYVGGSTGEGLLQSVEEREQVLEVVVKEVQGRVPVIAHVGALTTKDSVNLAQHAEDAGADALSSIPPFYYAYPEAAVRDHWLSIMNQTSLPFITYNIPSTTGFDMSNEFLKELCAHKQLLGMKITHFSTYALQQYKAIGGQDFLVFNGLDQQYLAGRVMGADAGIGSTYCIMPELFLKIEQEIGKNNIKEAQRWQFVVNEIITDVRALGLLASIKEILRLRGVDCGKPRKPLPDIVKGEYPKVKQVHEKIMHYIAQAL